MVYPSQVAVAAFITLVHSNGGGVAVKSVVAGSDYNAMPILFLLLDVSQYAAKIRPTLAESWRQRRFAPLTSMIERLLPSAHEFARACQTPDAANLLASVRKDMLFSRTLWQALVGDILFFSAEDAPPLRTSPESLCRLVNSGTGLSSGLRKQYTLIEQAHFGSRELTIDTTCYRPLHAGWNDTADVARLSQFLNQIDPGKWNPDDLSSLEELQAEDRKEELDFARECLEDLKKLYVDALSNGRMIICEVN